MVLLSQWRFPRVLIPRGIFPSLILRSKVLAEICKNAATSEEVIFSLLGVVQALWFIVISQKV